MTIVSPIKLTKPESLIVIPENEINVVNETNDKLKVDLEEFEVKNLEIE